MENKKYKVLALFGKSSAGKDTIRKWLTSTQNFHNIVPYTTRPKRDNEIDGIDYHFVSEERIYSEILNNQMLETTKFNNWIYGTSIWTLNRDKINVGVFNPQGLKNLLKNERLDILPIYIYCRDKERLLRSLNRELNPNCYEICRRFMADEEDFKDTNLDFKYVYYLNYNNDIENILLIPKINNFIKDISN